MSADGPQNSSRRSLLTAAAAGWVGGLLTRSAVAAEPVAAPAATPEAPPRPVVAPDASKVLGQPSTPTSARSVFETPSVAPTGNVTGPAYSPIQSFHGTITPTDLQFQRHHGGIAQIDPLQWKLVLHGLVERPLVFQLADLKRYPSVTRTYFLECSGNGRNAFRDPKPESTCQHLDGLVSNLEWTGVPLRHLLVEAGVKPEAKWFVAEGGDAALLARSIPLAKALDDALLVYAANGEPLRPAHGYPVRLFLPGFEANTCVKWLRRIELTSEPLMARDETSKYTDPLPGGKTRQFSFDMDVKSVITSPTFPEVLTGPGWWPITGLAWSGRGRVTRVEVSTDGGKSWRDAELQGEGSPKAQVRFVLPWKWDGQPTRLMSRASDETGATQPTVATFRRVRGPGTDFHFNAIRTWAVAADGRMTFVADPEAA